MIIRLGTLLTAAWFGLASFSATFAQESEHGLHVSKSSPRALSAVLFELKAQHNWLLTYEEGPVLASDELATVVSPTGLPVLVKRIPPVSLDLAPEQVNATDLRQRLAVINSVLAAYVKDDSSDAFRATADGAIIHVDQVSFRGPDGASQAFEPMLTTKISFPERHFADLYELVYTTINQIGRMRGASIVLGTVPDFLQQYSISEVANDEPACEVLDRGFAKINGPRLARGLDALVLTWDLRYDQTGREYWFNITAVKMPPVAKPSPHPASKPNSANDDASRWFFQKAAPKQR